MWRCMTFPVYMSHVHLSPPLLYWCCLKSAVLAVAAQHLQGMSAVQVVLHVVEQQQVMPTHQHQHFDALM